jgi:hypothetical protein
MSKYVLFCANKEAANYLVASGSGTRVFACHRTAAEKKIFPAL